MRLKLLHHYHWLVLLLPVSGSKNVLKKRLLDETHGINTLTSSFPTHYFTDEGHAVGFPVGPTPVWYLSEDGTAWMDGDLRYHFVDHPQYHSDQYGVTFPEHEIDPHQIHTYQIQNQLSTEEPIPIPIGNGEFFISEDLGLDKLAPALRDFIRSQPAGKTIADDLKEELKRMGDQGVKEWFGFSIFLDVWRSFQTYELKKLSFFEILQTLRLDQRYYIPSIGYWYPKSLAPLLEQGWVPGKGYHPQMVPWQSSTSDELKSNLMTWTRESRSTREGISFAWRRYADHYRNSVYSWFLSHPFCSRSYQKWNDERVEKNLEFMGWASSAVKSAYTVKLAYLGVLMNHTEKGPKVLQLLREAIEAEFGSRYSILELEPSITVAYIAAIYASNAWDFLRREHEAMLGLQKILFGQMTRAGELIPRRRVDEISRAVTWHANERMPPHRKPPLSYYLMGPTLRSDHYDLENSDRLRPEFGIAVSGLIEAARKRPWGTKGIRTPEEVERSAGASKSFFFSKAYDSQKLTLDKFRVFANHIKKLTAPEGINLNIDLKDWELSSDRLEALIAHHLDWNIRRAFGNPRPVIIFKELEDLLIRHSPRVGLISPIDGLDSIGEVGIYQIIGRVIDSMVKRIPPPAQERSKSFNSIDQTFKNSGSFKGAKLSAKNSRSFKGDTSSDKNSESFKEDKSSVKTWKPIGGQSV